LAYVVFGEREAMPMSFYLGVSFILIAVVANGVLKLQRAKNTKKGTA
jgi:hypothetical protein